MNSTPVTHKRLPRLRQVIIPPLRASGLRHVVIPPLRAYFRYLPLASGKVFMWDHLAAHFWWLETRVQASTRFGATLDVDARDVVGRFIYYFGLWEPELTTFIQKRLKPADVFIDLGANVGYFSVLAARLVGDQGRVVAIEAIPRTFDILERNIARNHAHNIRAVNAAAWDKEESLTFFVSPDTIDATSTVTPSFAERNRLQEQCIVRGAPLSALLAAEEIARARLIKIDIEGAEYRLFPELAAIVERGRQDLEIVMEVGADTFDETIRFFRALGRYPYRLPNDYSAKPYCAADTDAPLRRMDALPRGETQADLVFSRVDAPVLT